MADPGNCGCCDPGASPTPELITNRPGLSAIAYRIGTFANFRATMLDALVRELPELTTRATDDHAITLLELWAAVADVLTFYQERIANEAYLRTAVQEDSVRRLAGLLGYRPRPGLSAEADIAFTLDDGASVTLPAGVRMMSLPGIGERPQTFETLEECAGNGALNRLRARPVPIVDTPLAVGRMGGLAVSGPGDLAAGDRLVMFSASAMEEKSVISVRAEDDARRIDWSPALTQDYAGGQIFRVVRALRFFGWNAPDSYPFYDPGDYNAAAKTWNRPPMWITKSTAAEIGLPEPPPALMVPTWPLEARISGLAAGTPLVVAHDGKVELASVLSVMEAPRTLGPFVDTVTVLTLSGVTPVSDRRTARILEVTPEPIALRPYDYPAQIGGGRITVVPPPAAEISAKRRILIDDGNGTVHAAVVTDVTHLAPPGGGAAHLAVDFTPALPGPLDAAAAVLLGNVARAGHGETQADETLGDGDGGRMFQSFTLSKPSLTRRPSSTDIRGMAALDVLVDGVRWQEAESLYARRRDERVYTLAENDDGKTQITFGDGRTGARLPSGRGNVIARYRKGLGLDGMVGAGKLNILLTRPPGLREAANPASAEAGADPEDIGQAQVNAPVSVRTFGRIVSIEDFAWLATASGEIAKASPSWVWRGLDRVVHLTVAAQGGGDLSITALTRLHSALDAARDPNYALLLANTLRVPIRISAKLVVEPDRDRVGVLIAARANLLDRLSFSRAELGRSLHSSQVIAVLQATVGVAGVDLDVLHFREADTWTAAQLAARGATARPDQPHLRLFAARAPAAAADDPIAAQLIVAGVEVVPAEIATLADADLTLSATGGIA